MSNLDIIRGRQAVVTLTNKSGGSVVAGDVVVVDTANDESFTTTTTGSTTVPLGVVQESIANNASGRVAIYGYVSLVNVPASVTRGHYLFSHTVAKQATGASARAAGAFGVFLKGGTTPSAFIWTNSDPPAAAASADLVGPTPRAFPIGYDNSAAYSTVLSLAANGGSLAIAMIVPAGMRLESVSYRSTDTSTARKWGWDLYEQNGETNVLDRVAASSADESFTPSGASIRTITAGSAPVVLEPGVYWLVIQNRHATNTLGVGTTAASGIAAQATQTKTTTNPNGSTLDFTAATWTAGSASPAALMNGRVFGQSTAFP